MESAIGYLSVRQHSEHGYFGGYLVLNNHARPLEFYCTLPVKPNKAHELLYGPTLTDFVCGEQIAKSLIQKAKLKPELLLTDCSAVLTLENVSSARVAQLPAPSTDASHLSIPKSSGDLRPITVDDHQLFVRNESKTAKTDIEPILRGLSSSFELEEPFQRILHALLEAHPVAKAA